MSTKVDLRERGSTKKESLTNQQQIFVDELLASDNFSIVDAAKKAGYKNPSGSGIQLLKNKVVKALIGKALRDRQVRTQWSQDDIILRLRNILELDITELYSNTVITMENIKNLPSYIRQMITKISVTKKFTIDDDGNKSWYDDLEVEFMDKNKALDLAMRHFGLLQPELHVHVLSDEVKEQVIIELMSKANEVSTVIDAKAVQRLAIDE